MTPTDYRIVDAIAGDPSRLRARIATVVSVQSDYTMTVRLAGTTEDITGVNYLGSVPPRPNGGIWVLSDGRDLYGFGAIAADDRTLAPRASRSTNQTIANGNDTAVDFDGVNSDAWGCWASGANAARLTAPLTGRYMAVAQVQWEANGTGFRRVWIEKGGTSTLAREDAYPAAAGSAMWMNVTTPPFDMTAGDYIRLLVRQSSGGNLGLVNSSNNAPSLSLIYLGP